MRCEDARERLLVAEPEELEGGAATDLGRHLAACPACGRMARSILEQEGALGSALSRMRPRRDADPAPASPRWGVRARRAAPVALLAAAAVALLVLLPRPGPRQAPAAYDPPASATPDPLEVSADGPFAVLATGDPDVTIIWLY